GWKPEAWQAVLRDPQRPLLNRVYQGAYPPASTFKLIVAAAALRARLPMVKEKVQCTGHLELPDRELNCWKEQGHGWIDLHEAIVESCDVYFYLLGDALGMARIAKEAFRWGLGHPTGLPMAGEATGYVPDATRRRWFRGETMIAAIGQGAVSATPLQMARVAAAIANGGRLLVPKLVARAQPEVAAEIELPLEDWQLLRQAMRAVVASPRGTAFAAFRGVPWAVAGKTGTAQVVRADPERGEAPEDHAWFIGFAPYEAPRYAFAVFVEHGGHGGSAAAPIAAEVVRALMKEERR
ncbi:MAG: penicillin-binding protein 2, partial [Zetaproteobacteria bacterium]